MPGTLRALDPATTEGQLRTTRRPHHLSKIELQRGKAPTMAPWRKRPFIATSHITADAAEYFGLPRDRTVIIELEQLWRGRIARIDELIASDTDQED